MLCLYSFSWHGVLVYEEIPSYRAAFKTLSVPNLSQNLLTGAPGFREDLTYVQNNKTNLLDKVIDRSVIGSPGNTNESGYLILDGDLNTKFCTDTVPASVVFTMKEETTIDSYIIYTANDTATNNKRNPQKWVFCGSDDGNEWTVLDSVSEGNLPDVNFTGVAFKVSNPGAYKYYALKFFSTNGASVFQISELKLYSGTTSPVQSVKDMINNIPSDISTEDGTAITSARKAYDSLSSEDKNLVTNYSALTDAERKFAELSNEMDDLVSSIIDMIDKLPETITLSDEASVAAIRASYEKLDDEYKTLVTNYSVLTDAEKKIAELKEPSEPDPTVPVTGNPSNPSDPDEPTPDTGDVTTISIAYCLLIGAAAIVLFKRRRKICK